MLVSYLTIRAWDCKHNSPGIQFLTDDGVYPWAPDDLIRRVMAFPALIEAQLKAPKGSFNFLIEQM